MTQAKTKCPYCQKRYLVDEDFIGETVECEICHREFLIAPMAQRPKLVTLPEKEKPRQTGPDISAKIEQQAAEIAVPNLLVPLKKIEPATFLRGFEKGFPAETPVHKVTITKPFWIGKCLVTQKEYETITGRNPSYFVGDFNPVEALSWDEANDFCEQMTLRLEKAGSLKNGEKVRLPTEAEWELACRPAPQPLEDGAEPKPGSVYCYGFNPDQLCEYAWYAANSDDKTHPVGEKKPSPRGLYDVHGNVGEWCLDWFAPYGEEELFDPKGPEEGKRKVRRGGSFASNPRRCTASDRVGVAPDCRSAIIGFRVVLASS